MTLPRSRLRGSLECPRPSSRSAFLSPSILGNDSVLCPQNQPVLSPKKIGWELLGFRAGTCVHARFGRRWKEPPPMLPTKLPNSSANCSASLTVQELDQSKMAVLNMLASAHSRRSYKHAIEKFIAWYCSEPRLGFNRSVVVRYLSYSTICDWQELDASPHIR